MGEALRECSGHFLFTGCHTSRPTMLSQTKVSKVSPLLSHPLKSQSLSQKTPALLTQFEMDKVECIWGFLRKQTSFEANIGPIMLPWKESSEGTSTSCLPVATTRASSQWGQSVPFWEHCRLGWCQIYRDCGIALQPSAVIEHMSASAEMGSTFYPKLHLILFEFFKRKNINKHCLKLGQHVSQKAKPLCTLKISTMPVWGGVGGGIKGCSAWCSVRGSQYSRQAWPIIFRSVCLFRCANVFLPIK